MLRIKITIVLSGMVEMINWMEVNIDWLIFYAYKEFMEFFINSYIGKYNSKYLVR